MSQEFWQHDVLIVDDNAAFRMYLRTLLEKKLKVTVHEANDPRDAFDFLKTKIPSLIVLDMEMPYMDGLTALRLIRQDPLTKDVPVVACTVLNSKELVVELAELNICDFILKDNTPDMLVKKFEKIISSLPDKDVSFKIL
jgi:CheY-like chemotaxis protein